MSKSKSARQYMGVLAIAPPDLTIAERAPTSADKAFNKGQLWLDTVGQAAYQYPGSGDWITLGSGTSGGVVSLTGDSGGAIVAVGGNIDIVGDATDGASVVGTAGTLTINIAAAGLTQRGTLETATDLEAIAKASTLAALTPSNLAALGSSTTFAGLVELATNAEANARVSTSLALTPSNLASLAASVSMTVTGNPILESAATTGAAPLGTTGATNIMMLQGGEIWEQFILGAGQTIIAPRMSSTGLLISLDLTSTEGAEYNPGPRNNTKYSFTIGTTAAFYFEATLNAADVSGCDPLLIGFRKVEANNATFTSYTDYATIGLSATDGANIWLKTELNSGGTTSTDTTNTWVDGASHTLRVNVSAAGVVTYLIDGVAPSVTAAFTFDTTDIVIPIIRLTHGATAPGAINLVSFKCGLQ